MYRALVESRGGRLLRRNLLANTKVNAGSGDNANVVTYYYVSDRETPQVDVVRNRTSEYSIDGTHSEAKFAPAC